MRYSVAEKKEQVEQTKPYWKNIHVELTLSIWLPCYEKTGLGTSETLTVLWRNRERWESFIVPWTLCLEHYLKAWDMMSCRC